MYISTYIKIKNDSVDSIKESDLSIEGNEGIYTNQPLIGYLYKYLKQVWFNQMLFAHIQVCLFHEGWQWSNGLTYVFKGN